MNSPDSQPSEVANNIVAHYCTDDSYPGGKVVCTCARGENHPEHLIDVPLTIVEPSGDTGAILLVDNTIGLVKEADLEGDFSEVVANTESAVPNYNAGYEDGYQAGYRVGKRERNGV